VVIVTVAAGELLLKFTVFELDVAVIAVAAFITVNATAPLVLALKLASPAYFAVTLCDPATNT
jgi:hypothetical protein